MYDIAKQTPCSQCIRRRIPCQPRLSRRRHDSKNLVSVPRSFAIDVRNNGGNPNSNEDKSVDSSWNFGSEVQYSDDREAGFDLGDSNSSNVQKHGPSSSDSAITSSVPRITSTVHGMITPSSPVNSAGSLAPFSPSAMSISSLNDTLRPWSYAQDTVEYNASLLQDFTSLDTAMSSESDFNSPINHNSMHSTSDSINSLKPTGTTRDGMCGINTSNSNMTENTDMHCEEPADDKSERRWTSFRCNPLGNIDSLATKYSLDRLSEISFQMPDILEVPVKCHLSIEQVEPRTRDTLVAMSHTFFQNALSLSGRVSSHAHFLNAAPSDNENANEHLMPLPSSEVLERLLLLYAARFEHSFPSTPAAVLDPNVIMHNHVRYGAIQLLLMIALGAMTTDTIFGNKYSAVLIECCRVQLLDISERRHRLGSSTLDVVLRCGLLYTLTGAWSGEQFYTDSAIAQTGMYLSILRQSVLSDPDTHPDSEKCQEYKGAAWGGWKAKESTERLAYSFINAVLELSLFHELPCPVTAKELEVSELCSDQEVYTSSAEEWTVACERSASQRQQQQPARILPWFRDLAGQNFNDASFTLNSVQLRLCLNFLIVLMSSMSQMRQCVPVDGMNQSPHHYPTDQSFWNSLLRDMKKLLQAWRLLEMRSQTSDSEETKRPATLTNAALYHLISMNMFNSFSSIEGIARQGPSWRAVRQFSGCVNDSLEIWIHAAQVLRLVRSMSLIERPLWWAAAVYRAALASWAASLAHIPQPYQGNQESFVQLDIVDFNDKALEKLRGGDGGTPVLTRNDGKFVALSNPLETLQVFIQALNTEQHNTFVKGIKSQLETLFRRWNT